MKSNIVLHVYGSHPQREAAFYVATSKPGVTKVDHSCRRHYGDEGEEHLYIVIGPTDDLRGLRGLRAKRILEDVYFLPPLGWYTFKREIVE